jgi:hypothetical protein
MNNAGKNRRATLVKELAHVRFIALIFLRLEDNEIQSIEGLSHVEMPHIQKLGLGTQLST